LFCPNTVRYIIDFSRSIASPQSELGPAAGPVLAMKHSQ
jgi:hypothetical protein